MSRTGRRLRNIFLVIVIVLVVGSVATAPREPTPATPLLEGAQVDPRVLGIFHRACQDCHSNATYYPWYSYVLPVSLLINSDISRGRRHLNLSQWPSYPPVRKERLLSEIANQVRDRDMPLPIYTFIHRNARLSDADIDAVFQWTQAERARLIATSAAPR